MQGAGGGASTLLQLCEHAEACAGQCCTPPPPGSGPGRNVTLSIPCVQDHEINMLGEVTHLQTILGDLITLTAEPSKLPAASEQV